MKTEIARIEAKITGLEELKKTAEELREAADNLDATIKSIENLTAQGIGIYLELEACKPKKDGAVGKGSIPKAPAVFDKDKFSCIVKPVEMPCRIIHSKEE